MLTKYDWFESNHCHFQAIAEQVHDMAGALMYSEMVEEYLELFPDANFNSDYVEYLKEK